MRHDGFYSRYSNPTVRSFEQAVAELEGAEESLAFASGMGAIASTVFALCSTGSHIVAQRQLYAGTLAFLQGPCRRMGIEVTYVDVATPGAFTEAVQPSAAVLSASATNPYGHPADEVMARYLGIPVFRTDEDGSVTVSSDGARLWISSQR